jgi:hypothetical protein
MRLLATRSTEGREDSPPPPWCIHMVIHTHSKIHNSGSNEDNSADPIVITQESDLVVWGVVTGSVRQFRK